MDQVRVPASWSPRPRGARLAMAPSIVEESPARQIPPLFRPRHMPASSSNGEFTTPVSRRLAAVAFVDIVGYSILMARDETRTHQRWMAILDQVIRPQLGSHGGRLVKSTGDGGLVGFSRA